MNEQLLSFLSLTKRAGRLALGFDVVKEAVLKQRTGLVLCTSDLSPKTEKEINLICSRAGVERRTIPATMDEIWFLVGKHSGILAVTDAAFAKKLSELLESVDETNRRDTI